MAIDPNIVTTIRVGELPPENFNLTDNLPHEIGGELKRGTVQQLADVIGAYLGTTDSLAFNPTTVSDGGTLPSTTSNEWMLVGKGTFQNVGGGADIVTTEELNAITSNGTYWSLAVEIPINVELAGITQNIRSGYTSTTPSEDAVFNRLAEIIGMIPGQQTTDEILNNSDVDGTRATDALNNLNSKIPENYTKVVYVDNNNPNSATVFDINNPPTVNDNLLKSDVNNLYIGLDASTWVYNSSVYVTKTVPVASAIFYNSGTSTPANNTTAPIGRTGSVAIGSVTPVGKLDVFTGLSGMYPTYSTIPLGTFVFGNFSTLNTVPTIYTKSNTSIGMAFVGGTNDTNSEDMRFEVRENDGTDFSTLTSIGFKFRRFNTSLFDIYRNGNATLLGNLTIPNGTTTNHAVNKGQLDLKADNLLTGYVSGAGTVMGTDTVLQAIQKLGGNIIASDASTVKLTGNQTKNGLLTFNNSGGSLSNGIVLNNNGSNINGAIAIGNNSTGVGLYGLNASTGELIVAVGGATSTGLLFVGKNNTTNTFTVNKLGDVVANTVTLANVLKLKAYTVGTLPTGAVGDMAYVTDALAPTYNATVVGGGAIKVPVFFNGTNWTAH